MGIKVAVMNFEIEEAYQKKQQELEEKGRLREEKRKQLEYEKELKDKTEKQTKEVKLL
ncbi:MAG: hypothetical protein IPL21_12870 [Saprospirales bacterium]|nr:hypothetical protein [Saprospirales bacterium]